MIYFERIQKKRGRKRKNIEKKVVEQKNINFDLFDPANDRPMTSATAQVLANVSNMDEIVQNKSKKTKFFDNVEIEAPKSKDNPVLNVRRSARIKQ